MKTRSVISAQLARVRLGFRNHELHRQNADRDQRLQDPTAPQFVKNRLWPDYKVHIAANGGDVTDSLFEGDRRGRAVVANFEYSSPSQ